MAADVHPEQIGRGVAEQIGLACRISPATAARRLNTARALWFELPDTYSRLVAGQLHERIAETVVSETQHLNAEIRGHIDQKLNTAGMTRMGFKAAAACIRKAAYEADREGYVQRGRTERKHRRVGVRPAPDTMAILSGYLPVEQGVAWLCRFTATRRHRQSLRGWPDPRSDHGRHAGGTPHRPTQRRRCECGVADHDAAGGAAGSAQRQTGNHSGLWVAAG
jgi:hypothetical protein